MGTVGDFVAGYDTVIPLMRSGDYVPWEVGGLLPGRYLGIRVL